MLSNKFKIMPNLIYLPNNPFKRSFATFFVILFNLMYNTVTNTLSELKGTQADRTQYEKEMQLF